jgi:hypothetical protein
MKRKFYSFLSSEEQQNFSLNILLAEELSNDSSSIDIRGIEDKADSILHGSRHFACNLFNKHISRSLYIPANDVFIKEQL